MSPSRNKNEYQDEWVKKKINEGDIACFKYREFNKISKVGEGGFAIVYKAETCDKKQVALKEFRKKRSEIEKNGIEKFVKEVKI
jgi:hypothetical protein